MRLRIVHQLALLMAGIVLLAGLAIGGVVAWNLRTGFSDYLRARDAQQLERFAQVVAERVDWATLPAGPLPMRELMDEFSHREGRAPPPDWRPPPPQRGPGGFESGPPPRQPPPERRGPPDGLGQRVQVVDPQGGHLGGPRFAPGRPLLEQPVVVDGRTVAIVRMLPSDALEGVDARFLRRQYTGLALTVGAVLVLALGLALWGARRIAQPLQQVRAAARRIAGGELGVAVPDVAGSREMAELIADVNRMAASLARLEGARRRWIAQISHELRTPLSVLLGELESVQDGAREATPALVGKLRDEVTQLVRLVNDLHLLSMADLGALPCHFDPARVGALVERAVERFRPRLLAAGLLLEVQAGEDLGVAWDAGRIDQLLGNLLENSARHTDAPGRVRIGWRTEAQGVLLHVEDTPPGVPREAMQHLFEPLFRTDTARRRATGGSGLGLSICKAIVQAHGGRIEASASPLGGLRIEVWLPREAGEGA
jgi:two-component system sensor histidine kinase BaeS